MSSQGRAAVEKALLQLFDAERAARDLRRTLADTCASASPEVLDALSTAVGEARLLPSEDERTLRLSVLASLLGEVGEGPRVVDLLVDVLGSEEPEARHAAGIALEEIAFDRFKEVALAVERAVARLPPQSPALTELPYLLAGVPEPGVSKLLHRFLEHPEGDVVAAAIEATVELGDPAAARHLEKLARDTRLVDIGDEENEEGEVGQATIGELAAEAIDLLRGDGRGPVK